MGTETESTEETETPELAASPLGVRRGRIAGAAYYLPLPLAIWLATGALVVAIGTRAAFFGWSDLLTGLALVAVGAIAGSVWLGMLLRFDRHDGSLELRSGRFEDREALLPLVRRVLESELGVEEEREWLRGRPAGLFHGLWPGVRYLPRRVAFRCRRGLTFVYQSLTDPDRGEVVHSIVQFRAGTPAGRPDGRRLLARMRREWLSADAVPILRPRAAPLLRPRLSGGDAVPDGGAPRR
jgi:hypothetical protein